jgi:glycerophosphoryl diester phosphodiesterase
MSIFPKLLYAHRGASLKLPENTLAAFKAGLEDGANALELDVHRTKDDVIVVIHDAGGMRVAGEAAFVRNSTYEQIRVWKLGDQKVPSLREIIEAFPGIPLNVDIKDGEEKTVRQVVELVKHLGAEGRVLLAGKSTKVMRALREAGYAGPIGMSAQEVAVLYFMPKALIGRRFEGRAAQVPLGRFPIRFATRRFIAKCHALGVRVDFWVINDAKTAERLLEIGADGIMSDDPASVFAVIPCLTRNLE